MRIVKIYGERNSGTNFLEQLLRENFAISILKYLPSRHTGWMLRWKFLLNLRYKYIEPVYLGWKHSIPNPKHINAYKSDDLRIFCIYKNPYTFLLSLYNHPYHIDGPIPNTFSEFIRTPWKCMRMDNCRPRLLENPVFLWNLKNQAYNSLAKNINKPIRLVKYESLLADYETVLSNISDWLGLLSNRPFKNIQYSTKADFRSFSDFQDYYLNKEWKSKLTKEDILYINQYLDPATMNSLGYEFLM